MPPWFIQGLEAILCLGLYVGVIGFFLRRAKRRFQADMAKIRDDHMRRKQEIVDAHRLRAQQLEDLRTEMCEVVARQRRGEIDVVQAMNAFDDIQRRTDQLLTPGVPLI